MTNSIVDVNRIQYLKDKSLSQFYVLLENDNDMANDQIDVSNSKMSKKMKLLDNSQNKTKNKRNSDPNIDKEIENENMYYFCSKSEDNINKWVALLNYMKTGTRMNI